MRNLILLSIVVLLYGCGFEKIEGCGEPVEHQGYNYSTVQIGDQCWFAENCRYLPVVSPASEGSTNDSYYYVNAYEGTDVAAAKSTENYKTYGVLYTLLNRIIKS